MSTLNFFGAVNLAVRKVQEAGYTQAELYEVDCTSSPEVSGGVSTVEGLNQLRAVFNTNDANKPGTAITQSLGSWSEFGDVQYIDQPWLEDVVIPWPTPADVMLPDQAVVLMRQAGYSQNFLNMTFRWPLGPQVGEIMYMFTMADGQYVLVGAISGKIETEGASAKPTAAAPARPLHLNSGLVGV